MFTFSSSVSGQVINVLITNTASNYTVTWPTIKWQGSATQPVQTIGAKSDIYTFVNFNGSIYGAVSPNY